MSCQRSVNPLKLITDAILDSFGLIMQMRQVSNHPDLILKKNSQEGQNVLACQICDEVAEDAIRSQCKHDFCRACVKNYMQSVEETGATSDCPRCHIPLSIDLDQPEIEQDEDNIKKSSIINRIKMEDWTSSTKIEMLVYELYKLRSKKQTTKSIGAFERIQSLRTQTNLCHSIQQFHQHAAIGRVATSSCWFQHCDARRVSRVIIACKELMD